MEWLLKNILLLAYITIKNYFCDMKPKQLLLIAGLACTLTTTAQYSKEYENAIKNGGAVPVATTSAETKASAPQNNWWSNFKDPILDSLIYLGQNNNLDLAQAMRRIEVARYAIDEAKSGYYPQLNATLGWDRERSSAYTTRKKGAPMTSSALSLGVSMSWEVDLFGRVQAKIKEQQGAFRASRQDYDWMCVTISAEIVSAYMTLRTLQQEVIVTQEHIQQQEKVLKITEARHEAGLASMLDVAQAKTVYYSTQSTICTLETQIATTINSIAVLTGTYPAQMQSILSTPGPQPSTDWSLDVEINPDMLRNRPDVKEAEYTVEEMAAALGVAKKEWLPTLTLSAQVGSSAWYIKDMFKADSYTYSIAPQLSWTIFDGLSRNAQIASSREQMLEAIDAYNLTLLTAVQEADNALVSYRQAIKYEKEIQVVLENARLAYNLAIDRYRQGLDAFINVSDALMTVLEYANELVVARGNVLTALVSLQKALTL